MAVPISMRPPIPEVTAVAGTLQDQATSKDEVPIRYRYAPHVGLRGLRSAQKRSVIRRAPPTQGKSGAKDLAGSKWNSSTKVSSPRTAAQPPKAATALAEAEAATAAAKAGQTKAETELARVAQQLATLRSQNVAGAAQKEAAELKYQLTGQQVVRTKCSSLFSSAVTGSEVALLAVHRRRRGYGRWWTRSRRPRMRPCRACRRCLPSRSRRSEA